MVDNCLSDEIVKAIKDRLQAIKMPRVRLERREIEWEEVARESALYAGEIWRLLDACGVGPPPSPGMRAPGAEPTAMMADRDRWKANHDNQVAIKRIIAARPDLKDRAPMVEKLMAERNRAQAHSIRQHARIGEMESAIRETIMENLHLADGDVCTLKRLKDAIGFDLDSPENAEVCQPEGGKKS